jgi:hypothetical protein
LTKQFRRNLRDFGAKHALRELAIRDPLLEAALFGGESSRTGERQPLDILLRMLTKESVCYEPILRLRRRLGGAAIAVVSRAH